MKRWEYKTEEPDYSTMPENRLNKLGADGWELVTVNNGEYIFKRQKE